MKKVQKMFCAGIGVLALTFALSALADDLKQGVATVVRVKGQASYTLGGEDTWHPLVPGKILAAGATINTGPDSIVDVVLGKQVGMPQAQPTPDRITPAADAAVRGFVGFKPSTEQNVVRLSGSTTLKIDTLTVSDTGLDTVSDTELDLQSGRIFASVKKLSPASKYLVKIPNGIAGVRGTKFTLGADGSAGSLENSVWLAFGGAGAPTTVEVTQGMQYNPATGQLGPLSAETLQLLKEIANAAGTSFYELAFYAFNDAYLTRVSPICGYHPHP